MLYNVENPTSDFVSFSMSDQRYFNVDPQRSNNVDPTLKRWLGKISDIKEGDKILVKQRKRNKLVTLYKSESFTVTEKKGHTIKIRDAYEKKRVQNVAGVRCFRGESDSLRKVQ